MREEPKIIYYRDELEDEFSGDNITPRVIDKNYRYERSALSRLFWYRIVALPLAFLYMKLYFHHKIVNKKALRRAKGQPYFMYGNHTHFLADALVPTLANLPKAVSVIVNANNVSIPYLGRITPSLGALPLPDDGGAAKNFMGALKRRVERRECIMIYPEAHIWPYYTDIRPFRELSFRYPVSFHTPVFCLTNTYQKRKFSGKPKMVTYIDGPFYPDGKLPAKEQKKQLRDMVYEKMKERAKNNEVICIRYEKAKGNEL